MSEDKCLFCEISKGNVPSLKIYENEGVIAVLNIKPSTKGQVLLMPKKHYSFIQSVPEDVLFQLIIGVKAISSVLTQVLQCPGINVLYNMGKVGGQKVGHVSIHIIPRYAGDKVSIELPEEEVEEEDLYDQQRLIVKAFQQNTVKLLKAIKKGEIKVSDEVKQQAIKTLENLEKEKAPKNPLKQNNKVDVLKLEDELEKL